jgi:AcrR family transcriptional regulator
MVSTRQQILEATERVIHSKGLARVTTKEIAREAGYAEGTLYKHFVTKEELFLAVVQEYLPDFATKICIDCAGKATIQANLEEIAYATIEYYEKLLPLAVSLFADADLLTRHRQWMQEQSAGPLCIYERVGAYIEAEQQLGRIGKELHSFNIAAALLGPCFQYVFLYNFMGTQTLPVTRQQFVSELVQLLTKGVLRAEC